jgi:hypothetical protein
VAAAPHKIFQGVSTLAGLPAGAGDHDVATQITPALLQFGYARHGRPCGGRAAAICSPPSAVML